MKKLLVYANYYYPEVASLSQLYTELFEGLSKDFDITVICAVPCYTGEITPEYLKKKYYFEEHNGVKIIRVRVANFSKQSKISRVKHILSYFFNSIGATFKTGKQDIVFTCSQPPVLGGILGVIGKFITKGKLVYNIQDFNPEQTIAVKYSGNKLVLGAMMAFDKHSCKKSDLVITVGRDMQKTLEKRFEGKKVPQNTVINNWMNEKEVYPLDDNNENVLKFKKKYGLEDKFIIMYSGNVGLFYDFENIIKIMGKFKNETDTVFAIVGEGAMVEPLTEYCKTEKIENIVFIPYQDKKDLIYSLNAANVHLVMNAKGIKGVSVPSKIYGILSVNKPVLGILEKETEAWKIIEHSDCGALCEAGDYLSIEKTMSYVINQKELFTSKHRTGRQYLVDNFTKDKSVDAYKKALMNL